MSKWGRRLVNFIIGWLVGAAFLGFQYLNPEIFPTTARAFSTWGVVGSLTVYTLLMLWGLPIFNFLRKPIWGYKKTATGYEDASLKDHPYMVWVLVGIIVASFAYIFFLKLSTS